MGVATELRDYRPEKPFFVGIDSDGCAFDTMELKHKECFIPQLILHWGLQPVSKYARETWEFVNLYSRWRGVNRFKALVLSFQLLRDRPEVLRRGVSVPELHELGHWTETETRLGNPALEQAVRRSGSRELKRALEWSRAVNAAIAEMVHGVPPFPYVRESLERLACFADVVVVSATPTEALVREWTEHGLDRFVRAILGQEAGTKKQMLETLAPLYPPNQRLMIGDAPGDHAAAQATDTLFYPIVPGDEEASWQYLFENGIKTFQAGQYGASQQDELLRGFYARLPELPPWRPVGAPSHGADRPA